MTQSKKISRKQIIGKAKMKQSKNLEAQITDVQSRLESAIANGHTKLAAQEAKLLENLTKIKSPLESATKQFDIVEIRKERDALFAELSAKLERINAAEMAKSDVDKNRIG